MTDNSVIDALRARFCKNSSQSLQESSEPKKRLIDLNYALEKHFDEEDEKARSLWLHEIQKEAKIFANLTESSALSFLQKINRNLERKYDEKMARKSTDAEQALNEYENLAKILKRDDLVDILEKYGRIAT